MRKFDLGLAMPSIAALAISLSASSAAAQSADSKPMDSVAEQGSQTMDSIIVVARRREENIQDVPASIGLLSQDDLEARNIVSVQDIKSAVANVATVGTQTPGGGLMVIRGISANATADIALDSQIGLYVDGVYLGRAQSSGGDLTDIARLEVYRGPQGTLFGKNSTGGAINFITAAPTGEFGIDVTAAVGNFDRRFGKLTLNSPRLGGFSFRLTYQHEEIEGDVKNVYDGPDYRFGGYGSVATFGRVDVARKFGAHNSESLVAKARYDGIDGLTVDYKYDYSSTRYTPSAVQAFGFNSTASGSLGANLYILQAPGAVPISFDKLGVLNQDGIGTSKLDVEGHLVNVAYEIDDHNSFKSISAYRKTDAIGSLDLDGGAYRLVDPVSMQSVPIAGLHASPSLVSQKQWSQEFQLIGEYDPFDYLLGFFYFHEKAQQHTMIGGQLTGFNTSAPFLPLVPGPDGAIPVPAAAVNQIGSSNNKAYAVYGSVNLRPIENLELAAGARYTWDRKGAADLRFDPAGIGRFRDDRLTYDASATYTVVPDINVYARYAKGYLAGGFIRGVPFAAEKTESYEAGVKSELFNGRLRLNVAAFHSKTTDQQQAQFVPGQGTIYFNIGTLKVDGFEIEATAQPIERLSLTANFGYVDPKPSNGDGPTTPNRNLSVSASYDTLPLFGSSYLSFRLDADYRSKYRASNLNNVAQDRTYPGDIYPIPASIWSDQYASQEDYFNALVGALDAGDYWLVNGRVSLMSVPVASGEMRVSGFVKNIFDEQGIIFPIDYGLIAGATFERGRTYGLELGFNF